MQNTTFISLITKFASVIIKQKMDTIITNYYFKLAANNIRLSILNKFFLEKIDNNIKINTTILQSLLKKITDMKKTNATNLEIDIFAIITSAVNSKKNHQF